MFANILRSKFSYFIILLYLLTLVWWIYVQSNDLTNTFTAYIFDWFYGLIALSGGIFGIYTSIKKWGGFQSLLGKGLIFLSLGLIVQWFGLQVWTYYNVIAQVETPYPSLADLGYFALIPCYTIAAVLFASVSGAKFSLRTSGGKIIALVIPFIALAISYSLFLKDIGFDTSDPLRLFLDFGYPLGEIIPVSIAIFTLTLAKNLLGGSMRSKIVYLVGAFFFQFLTEYFFLYQAGLGSYVNGGINDIMYATSYTVMSLGIIAFNSYD